MADNTVRTPTFDDELRIATHFPRPFFEDWENAAQKKLGDRPLQSLDVETHEGIRVRPLYSAEDLPSTVPAFETGRRGAWEVACPIDLRDPKGTIGRITEAIDHGADSLWFWVDRRSSSWGRLTAGAISLFLEAAQGVPFYLDGRGAAPAMAALLVGSWRRLGSDFKDLAGAFDIDPLGTLAADGALPTSLDGSFDLMAEAVKWCQGLAPRTRAIAVSTLPHGKAGATATQELSIALANGVTYLRAMDSRGVPPDVVCGRLRFLLPVGRDLFMEVAKLRAIRLLWARIAEACGVPVEERGIQIHAITSPRCLTIRDPWVNLLRGTAETYAAVIGGANVITVLPFDSLLGQSDSFARRLAVNTSNILREESLLHVVQDPAAGSYYVERLTHDLATIAWEDFQRIETSGGALSHLRSGSLGRELAESLASKRRAVATLREPITGVSSYPDLEEKQLERERGKRDARLSPDDIPTGVHQAVGRPQGSFNGVLEAAHAGTAAAELVDLLRGVDTVERVTALPTEREARPFEALRDTSDRHFRAHGVRPRVFIAAFAQTSKHRAAVASITNLLAAGGLIAVLGENLDDPEAAAAAFAASGTRSVVVIASGDRAPEVVPAMARQAKAMRARRVLVVGNPGRLEGSWREAGVDAFIRGGEDAVALLTDLLEVEGVDRV